MLLTTTIGAGNTVRFSEAGDFFRILECDAPVNATFYASGREIADADGINAGYAERFGAVFDAFEITAPAGATIQFVARLGNAVEYNKTPTGKIRNSSGVFAQSAKEVTNASGLLLAANSERQVLLIQNRDSAGSVYLNLAGAAATTAAGLVVTAGGSLLIDQYMPSGEIYAIGDIASNPNIIVIEA